MGIFGQTMYDPLRAALNSEVPDWSMEFGGADSRITFGLPTGSNNVGPNVMEYDAINASGIGALCKWDRLDLDVHKSADTDMLILFQYLTVTTADDNFYLIARASGSAVSENGYTLRDAQPGTLWEISEWSAGTESILGSFDPGTLTVLTWYWAQLRVTGDQIKGRVWAHGSPNPHGWGAEATDSTHSAIGFTGFGTSFANDVEVDFVSVGTDGDFAQLPFSTLVPAPGLIAVPARVQVGGTSLLIFTGAPNIAVEWAVIVGDGTITVIGDQTDDQGQAVASYTPGTVDTNITIQVTYGT